MKTRVGIRWEEGGVKVIEKEERERVLLLGLIAYMYISKQVVN